MNKSIELKNATKSKILFRSEDGVDIFEGSMFYGVWKDCKGQASHLNSDQPNMARLKSNSDGMFTFSTKKAAETFILMNKPCLSVREICPVIGQCNNNTHIDLDKLTEKLKKLVESK